MDKIQAEFSDYIKSGFNLVKTADDSLSLMQEGLSEEMHSRSGAFSESLYIYYEPLKAFVKESKIKEIEVISVGLGFGYNELLAGLVALEPDIKMKLVSFEKEEVLIKLFKKRLGKFNEYPEFFKPYLRKFSKEDLEKASLFLSTSESVFFNKELNLEVVSNLKQSSKVILFDAYCNKTSEGLWSEGFLNQMLKSCKVPSLISTYACTGSLNRSLRKSGFVRDKKRTGFAGKREATLAFKV